MHIIKKVLNSSVVLVEDDRGVERVLLGKGIGFSHRPGEVLPPDAHDRVFVELDGADQRNFVDLVSQIPVEFVELARAIVTSAEAEGLELDPHIYLSLTDHLHFAIERQRRGIVIVNRLVSEVRNLYPRQHLIGLRAVGMLRQRFGVEIPDDEAANIAFHLVNAQTGRADVDAARVVTLVAAITKIVTHTSTVTSIGDDLHGARFLTHLHFFAERLFSGRMLGDDDFLLQTMRERHPEAVSSAERVRSFVRAEHDVTMPDEEVAYLALHIARASTPMP